MMGYRSTRIALGLAAAVALLVAGGCWMRVDTHCPGCRVIDERTSALPPLAPGTRALVILVHGAFGFGDEWRPVVDALRARPRVAMLVFSWSGPWTRVPSLPAEALRRLVQQAIDGAPPGAAIVVIAHSAGGALARYVAERLRVPRGRRVRIASIAAPAGMNLAPYTPEREVDTPLGIAVGGEQPPPGPIAPGVDFTAYDTADPPPRPPPAGDGVRHVWLGARVGHNASVAKAALPLVGAL